MVASTRVPTHLDLRGGLSFSKNLTEFPADPKLGMMARVNDQLFVYQKVGDLTTWYPITLKTQHYIHVQGAPSDSWVVAHNLGVTEAWYQVQDQTGNQLFCGRAVTDGNSFTLTFTSPEAGTCIVVAPTAINVPSVTATSMTAASMNIGGGKVTADAVQGLLVDGRPVGTPDLSEYVKLSGGKIPSAVLPDLAITKTFVVSVPKSNLYALNAQEGDVGIVRDDGMNYQAYILTNNNPALDESWLPLAPYSNVVQSVNGQSGVVLLDKVLGFLTPVQLSCGGDVSGSVTFDQGGTYNLAVKVLGDVVQTVNATGPKAIQFDDGSYVVLNVQGATTLTLSPPSVADGRAKGFTIEILNGGTNVTWPASVNWLSGSAPTLKSSGKNLITLITRDDGASWIGSGA